MAILSLAMPVAIRQSFDYYPPEGLSATELSALQPGVRVRAPFGNQPLIGILLAVKDTSDIDKAKLKAADAILDDQPILSPHLLTLAQWAARYYHHPIGDTLSSMLPTLLRKGHPPIRHTHTHWRLSAQGKGLPNGALKRAPQQARLLMLLQQQPSISRRELDQTISRHTIRALLDKKLIEAFEVEIDIADSMAANLAHSAKEKIPILNHEQQQAIDRISSGQGYQCYLLEGVTGSGKTEVYLRLMEYYWQRGQQTLVLIPEIGLTPQTLTRFQRRLSLSCPIIALHSGLNNRERLLGWQAARSGQAGIILGTRSAVFTPLLKLGLIIVDEEHDTSFKQQDGFRYCARNIAIKRAYDQSCAIVLGSATPSLETLHHALQKRYHHLTLKQRATGAAQPAIQLLDNRLARQEEMIEDGFNTQLLTAIRVTIEQGNQALVFINRRGFAPLLLCQNCGTIARCEFCDVSLTVHLQQKLLRCHHCEHYQPLPQRCPNCDSAHLDYRGLGTERTACLLQQHFPNTPIIRIDRDTTTRKTAMQDFIEQVNNTPSAILVGTQMLAKGHHFPDVTLVAILDIDGGLFTADFRGPEKMGQLLVQVAGRAGRASKPGQVLLQTYHADHPLITTLVSASYHYYAVKLLASREFGGLPPFGYLALLRAEAKQLEPAEKLLLDLRHCLPAIIGLKLFGPLPAPMVRRAGYHRMQLLLQANTRRVLHQALDLLCTEGDQHPLGKRLRWSLDVDPVDLF